MINPIYKDRVADAAWARELVDQVFLRGYVVLPDFLTPEYFAELKAFAEEHGYEIGDAMMTFSKNEGTIGHTLARSPEFMTFYNTVYKARCEKEGKPYAPLDPQKQSVGYPYKDARNGKKTPETDYHYDGAYINTTIAIKMPPKGGELIAFPNLRMNPKSFWSRVFSRVLRHVPLARTVTPHVVAKTVPNDLCLFFGDRTFHGVEPITSGERLIITINNHW